MEKMGREELVAMYRPDVERLAAFLPWLTDKTSADVVQNFTGEHGEVTLPFPVYDTILLGFLDTLGSTIFMNPNYHYIYSRYRIRDWHDELTMIRRADIMSMEILGGIFSRYTLGGMTKAYLWTEGMDFQIFYHAVKRAKEIIEYWDVPIVVEAIGMEEEQDEEPAAEWGEEPVAEWSEEPVAEWGEEPVAEPVAEWGEEPVAEPAAEWTEEPEPVTSEEVVEEEIAEPEPEEEEIEEVAAEEEIAEEEEAPVEAEEELEVEEAMAETEEPVTEETAQEEEPAEN